MAPMYQLTEDQAWIIWVVTLAAAGLSMFGSSFMLVTIFLYGKSRGLSRFIVFLAFGDWGWSLSVCIANTIILIDKDLYTYDLCIIFRIMFQFFAGSTVFWTTCISFYLYRCVFLWNNRRNSGLDPAFAELRNEKTITRVFHAVSFGIPAIFCGILFFGHQYERERELLLCFPKPAAHFYMWFLPIIVCFISAVIVYSKLMIKLKQSMSWRFIFQGFKNQSLTLPFRISLYLIVFFVCWALDVAQYAIITIGKWDSGEPLGPAMFTMVVTYNVLLQSQGTLDMFVYGIANKEVRRHYADRKWFCFLIFVSSPIIVVPCMCKGRIRRLCNSSDGYDQING